jgi:TetR/AcrR family transcriptional regulator, cholesterol catabolism regulator
VNNAVVTVGEVSAARSLSKAQTGRRNLILDTALGSVRQRGFDQVQMREVSEDARLSIGTLYRYFPSKEALMAHVLERWCEAYWEQLEHVSEGSSNVERLIELSRRSIKAFEDEPNFLSVANTLQLSHDPEIIVVMTRVNERSYEFFAGSVVGLGDDDAGTIADTVLAVIGAKLGLWIKGRIPVSDVYAGVERCIRMLLA